MDVIPNLDSLPTAIVSNGFNVGIPDPKSVSAQFAAIPSPLSEADGYHIHPEKIADEIARGTSVILTSNPRNPTGQMVKNPELAEIQDIARSKQLYGMYSNTN